MKKHSLIALKEEIRSEPNDSPAAHAASQTHNKLPISFATIAAPEATKEVAVSA